MLSITIVGGGIAGLTAAILLAQSGHHVIVLEHRDASYESRSMGGVSISFNGYRIIEAMGLKDKFARIVDPGSTIMRRYNTGEVVSRLKAIHPMCFVHRADLLKMLYGQAVKMRVDVRFQVAIDSIIDSQDQPTVKLQDGTEHCSDLIIGADGIDSRVRRTIFPQVSPELTPCTVFLVNISQADMKGDADAFELWADPPFAHIMGPGRSIVSWTMTERQVYHLQFCDYEYGSGESYGSHDPPEAPYITTETDTTGFIRRWSDFYPAVQHITETATSYTKWKIAQVPPLPSYTSDSGRIVLVGDAAHAIPPFAAQGAVSSIEDAQVLTTLLSCTPSKDEIKDALTVYDKLRVPRLAGIREIIKSNIRTFGMKDGEEQSQRDATLVNLAKKESELVTVTDQVVAGIKEYRTAERFKWIDTYDAAGEAKRAWDEFKSSKGGKSQVTTRKASL